MKLLSDHEVICLYWAALGKTSWEVGAIVKLSERTVNFHVHNACRKLGVNRRQAAIAVSLQAGLLPQKAELLPTLAKKVFFKKAAIKAAKKTAKKTFPKTIKKTYLAGKASPRKNSLDWSSGKS